MCLAALAAALRHNSNGADVRFIQALLGHANLGTTEIYTRVAIVKLKQVHEATHPARLHGPGAGEQASNPWSGPQSALLRRLPPRFAVSQTESTQTQPQRASRAVNLPS
ncbi:tyrosine-type recombinase/integrase [Massilia sp.]|uniref:tyrosine-type recombinase/integrase n=1 Tax=Massilia sp. TaxID=1882437 RepID=UPI0028A2918B|nr:tyrosine-type recombinase/integrase [Massilia sp.]